MYTECIRSMCRVSMGHTTDIVRLIGGKFRMSRIDPVCECLCLATLQRIFIFWICNGDTYLHAHLHKHLQWKIENINETIIKSHSFAKFENMYIK